MAGLELEDFPPWYYMCEEYRCSPTHQQETHPAPCVGQALCCVAAASHHPHTLRQSRSELSKVLHIVHDPVGEAGDSEKALALGF